MALAATSTDSTYALRVSQFTAFKVALPAGTTLDQGEQALVKGFGAVSGFSNLSSQKITFHGDPAYLSTFYTTTGSTTLLNTIYLISHGGSIYDLYSLQKREESALFIPVLTNMINSFQISAATATQTTTSPSGSQSNTASVLIDPSWLSYKFSPTVSKVPPFSFRYPPILGTPKMDESYPTAPSITFNQTALYTYGLQMTVAINPLGMRFNNTAAGTDHFSFSIADGYTVFVERKLPSDPTWTTYSIDLKNGKELDIIADGNQAYQTDFDASGLTTRDKIVHSIQLQ